MQKLSYKIYLSIFALLIAFVGVLGLLLPQNNSKVFADEITNKYTFSGAGIYFYSTMYDYLVFEPTDEVGKFTNVNCYLSIRELTSDSFDISIKVPYEGTFLINEFSTPYTRFVFDSWTYTTAIADNGTQDSRFLMHYLVDSGFNANVVRIDIFTDKWGGINNSIATHQIHLVDNNGKMFRLSLFSNFLAWQESNGVRTYSAFSYIYRSYFLSGDLTQNDYYNVGYNNGYSAGENAGKLIGQNQGYDNGFNVGYDVGYNDGVLESNDYSFIGLLGAVVDAPLSVFIDTFNFELLGFNLKDFFLAILTLCLIVTIVRLVMGGK